MNKILVLGDGLLGSEIVKQTDWDYISRKKNDFDFDIFETYSSFLFDYDTIVNCIAYTKTYSDEKQKHWNTNYKAVADLVDYCETWQTKLVQISTDYVYSNSIDNATEEDVPVHCQNWYSYTKLLADGYIQLKLKNYLLIRTSFKPNPFPYEKALVTQVGNFDYANIIADLIIRLIEKNAFGIFNVGTKRKTILDLALETKPEVIPAFEFLHPSMPTNITMDVTKMNEVLNE
jgi:dTDP-4-dehydrorhamnose reductase